MTPINPIDSAIIRGTRVFCIFFMMSVHLYPGASLPTLVTSGEFFFVGTIWIDYLSRASVAALSLISGYLGASAFQNRSILEVLKARGRVLLVPMVTWNAIMAVLMVAAAYGAHINTAHKYVHQLDSPAELINGLTGLRGPTLNLSLFFLRDLFVSSVLVALFYPFIMRAHFISLGTLTLAYLFDGLEPLVFRPSILLLMVAGVILRQRDVSLRNLGQRHVVLQVCAVVAILLVAGIDSVGSEDLGAKLANLVRRIGLIFIVFGLAAVVARTRYQLFLDWLEPAAYVAYLSHALLSKIIWQVFTGLGVTVFDKGYLLYFFGTPIAVILGARTGLRWATKMPTVLVTLLQGKKVNVAAPAPPRVTCPAESRAVIASTYAASANPSVESTCVARPAPREEVPEKRQRRRPGPTT